MKDSDKILIIAFLDGETNEKENAYLEKLLKEDSGAKDFLEDMKLVHLELRSSKESKELKSIKAWNEKFFIEQVSPSIKKNNHSLTTGIQRMFNSFSFKHVFGYALTALLFVSVGSNLNVNTKLADFEQNDSISLEYKKFRNTETVKDKLKETLDIMLEKKFLKADFKWGSDNYLVRLVKIIHNESELIDTTCYKGFYNLGIILETVEEEDSTIVQDFIYCKGIKDQTITFI